MWMTMTMSMASMVLHAKSSPLLTYVHNKIHIAKTFDCVVQ